MRSATLFTRTPSKAAVGRFLNGPWKRSVTFGTRTYWIDRSVFDPKRHLSGVAMASQVAPLVRPGMRVLDVGTGCGLLAGVAAQCGAVVVATDIANAAVACARRNLGGLGVDVRHGDMFAPVEGERFDLIMCNPPYEDGGSADIALASPDFVARFAAGAPRVGRQVVVGFPVDDTARLRTAGLDYPMWKQVATAGVDLGLFLGPTSG